MESYWFTCPTAFGALAVAFGDGGLLALSWPAESAAAAVAGLGAHATGRETAPGATWAGLVERLQAYFAGERVSFAEEPIDMRRATPFRRRAWTAVQRIPWGSTRTYGDVACELGAPLAARAVGGAMAANPVPIIVPCHRVLGADGALTGYAGGVARKRALLALEARA